MRTEMWLASVTIVAATVCASVEACDLCAIYAVNRAGADVGPGLFAGAAEQVTSFGTIQIEGAEVPNTWHQHLDSSIAQAFIGYNLNSRVAIQFNLPVLYR